MMVALSDDMYDEEYVVKCMRFYEARVPVAWMRAIPPVNTPDGPGDWEVDFSYGEDEPLPVAGQPWQPLYAAPREDI